MPRFARLVVPGLPHHVTQRGVRSAAVFRRDADRELYLSLMGEKTERFGVTVLAWCLMTNHVHMIVVPERETSLADAVGEAHMRYSWIRNRREGVRGYLFQGRFGSCVMDEEHLLAAARYVELNPVAAGIVDRPEQYGWSSARFHLGRRKADPLVEDRRMLGIVRDWRTFLRDGIDDLRAKRLEKHVSTGRPLGSDAFVEELEERTGRRLRPRKRGWRKGRKRSPR